MGFPPRYKMTGYDRGMEAATSGDWCRVTDAYAEIERLQGLLRHHGIEPTDEFICACGRRSSVETEVDF